MRELETDRLVLRHLREDDAQDIYDHWASDPDVTRYLTWKPHESAAVTKQILSGWLKKYDQPDCYRWGIERKQDGVLIGMIDVVGYHDGSPEIGYVSGKKYWGNGYMTEALHAVLKELFDRGFDKVVIRAVADNIGSNRVIAKNNFKYVKQEEQLAPNVEGPVMINYYELTKKDSEAS